jgi:hypothetical protein
MLALERTDSHLRGQIREGRFDALENAPWRTRPPAYRPDRGLRLADIDHRGLPVLHRQFRPAHHHGVHRAQPVGALVRGYPRFAAAIREWAFIGNYTGKGEEIAAKVTTQRHNYDPAFKPLFGMDSVTLTLKGSMNGDMTDMEGAALQLPGVNFKAVLTRICD